jgi:hypothetical protein
MQARRRERYNKIMNDIRESELFIKRSTDTIKRIKTSQMGETYVTNQIIKLKEYIKDKQECLEDYNKTLHELGAGYLDKDIEKEYKETENNIACKRLEMARSKAVKKAENEEKKEISQKYWKGIIAASRSHKQKERDIKYAYNYYNKVVDALPPYISNNLSEMPNNKGYIWRGINFYGYLPEQEGPNVMFEKQKGGILIIHEYTDYDYKRYEKDGKCKKKLLYRQIKSINNKSTNIMDYAVIN